jgi:hypothetical protein
VSNKAITVMHSDLTAMADTDSSIMFEAGHTQLALKLEE